jgi:hypothetical protein
LRKGVVLKKFENKTKEELLEIVFTLTSESTKVKAYHALKKQVDGITDYLNQNVLATKNNLSDKDEKSWDRGKVLLEKLSQYTKDLADLENSILNLDSKYVEKAAEGSLEDYLAKGK